MNIGEIGQLLTGLAAINSLRNSRKIDAVRTATDGIVTKLVATTKKEAFAAGQKDQQENGR